MGSQFGRELFFCISPESLGQLRSSCRLMAPAGFKRGTAGGSIWAKLSSRSAHHASIIRFAARPAEKVLVDRERRLAASSSVSNLSWGHWSDI
jgi:hypothetical protein